MHVLHALLHDITAQCMQLLHGLCYFDFVSDIPLLQLLCSTLGWKELTMTSTLAYYSTKFITAVKSFVTPACDHSTLLTDQKYSIYQSARGLSY